LHIFIFLSLVAYFLLQLCKLSQYGRRGGVNLWPRPRNIWPRPHYFLLASAP